MSEKKLIFEAIKKGDSEHVDLLLNHGLDPNTTTEIGSMKTMTPLFFAIFEKSNVRIFQSLLTHGANPNVTTPSSRRTPLHLTCSHEFPIEIMQLLLKSGADVSAKTSQGLTPLHTAVLHHSIEKVKLLLEFKANVNAKDQIGNTPLHRAVELRNNFPLVQTLLNLGADVNAENNYTHTPLYAAASVKNNEDAIGLLRELGAKMKIRRSLSPLLHRRPEPDNNKDKMDYLKKHGAEVNSKVENSPPLYNALWNGHRTQVENLLNKGTNPYFEPALCFRLIQKRDNITRDDEPHMVEAVSIFLHHLVKLRALNLLEDRTYAIWLTDLNDMENFEICCQAEVDKMRNDLVSKECDLTYAHILTEDLDQLEPYFYLDEINERFSEIDLGNEFPLYASMMEYKVLRIRDRVRNMRDFWRIMSTRI